MGTAKLVIFYCYTAAYHNNECTVKTQHITVDRLYFSAPLNKPNKTPEAFLNSSVPRKA